LAATLVTAAASTASGVDGASAAIASASTSPIRASASSAATASSAIASTASAPSTDIAFVSESETKAQKELRLKKIRSDYLTKLLSNSNVAEPQMEIEIKYKA
jgi:hypothetical protein